MRRPELEHLRRFILDYEEPLLAIAVIALLIIWTIACHP